MPPIECHNCGSEIEPSRASCPVCGAERHHAQSPEVWRPPAARRGALVAGILIALLILGALVWRVADSRRSTQESNAPIMPMGGESNPVIVRRRTGRRILRALTRLARLGIGPPFPAVSIATFSGQDPGGTGNRTGSGSDWVDRAR